MRRFARSTCLAAVLVVVVSMATPVAAATLGPEGFEGFALGTPDGQFGWQKTGSYDVEVVNNTYGHGSFGAKSLRISNATTSGSFGDHTFSASLADEAGESGALNYSPGGSPAWSGGTRTDFFSAEWWFASTDPTAEQVGLSAVASPDRGDGARMSWVQMADTSGGLEVNFYDYVDAAPMGSVSVPTDGCDDEDDFSFATVASGLSRAVPHHIKVTMDLVAGPSNDVVKVYVDGALGYTGTSWEDYFRWCEGTGGPFDQGYGANESRTLDSVLFRVGGTAAPSLAGKGFLIDGFELFSGDAPSSTTEIVQPNDTKGWGIFPTGAVAVTTNNATGEVVAGPGGQPSGLLPGSVEYQTNNTPGGKPQLYAPSSIAGTRFADVTSLDYSTYIQSYATDPGGDHVTPVLNVRLDLDGNMGTTGDRTTMVYEPCYNVGSCVGPVQPLTTWTTWDPMDPGQIWWATTAIAGTEFTTAFGSFKTLNSLVTKYPDAKILYMSVNSGNGAGGAPWNDFVGNVDGVTIGVNGQDTVYDFEPGMTSLEGSWDADVETDLIEARVQPPINPDGSSNFPKRRGVIPIQFKLFTGRGPLVLESICGDGCNFATDASNDYSYLSFTPTTEFDFDEIAVLKADYEYLQGDCGGGALRWSISLDTDGDGARNGSAWMFFGQPTTNCSPSVQSGVNLITEPSVGRWDISQLGGSTWTDYTSALTLLHDADVLRVSLVLDTGWYPLGDGSGDDRVRIDSATVNDATFVPEIVPLGQTCDLPSAMLKWSKNDASPSGAVNEAQTIQPGDDSDYYRVVDCKYMYNLEVGSLGLLDTREGTYRVWVNIDGTNIPYPAKFDLK